MNEYGECPHCKNMIGKTEQTAHILDNHPESEDAK